MESSKMIKEEAAQSITTPASMDPETVSEPNPRDIEKHANNDDDARSRDLSTSDSGNDDIGYDGPDDPYNPYNWSPSKKWMHAGLLAYMSFVVPTASTMFAPGVAQAMREFGETNETLGSLVVSIYLLGNGFGPLFIAPLSELYGRNSVYYVNNVLFIVFNVACAVASSFDSLVAYRFLAGVAGSAAITVGSGSIADMFLIHERGAAMAVWALGPLLGPVAGPIAGSYLGGAEGWRWIFWLMSILGGVGALATLVLLRETYAPVLLERKAKKLSKESGKHLRSKLATPKNPREYMIQSMVRPFRLLFRSPIVFLISLYMSLVYGYIYLLFTTMPSVFEGTYSFSTSNVGLAYIGIGVGMFTGLIIFGRFSDKITQVLAARNDGVMEPEYRLPLMFPGAPVVAAGLFIYGWTAQNEVHWIAPEIGTALIGFGLLVVFMPTLNYLVDAYTRYAASAVAANTVFRSVLGACLPLAGPAMYNKLDLGWGNSLLAFIALATSPIPFVFYKYGKAIRSRTSGVDW